MKEHHSFLLKQNKISRSDMVYKDSGVGPKSVIWHLVHLPLCSNRSNLVWL